MVYKALEITLISAKDLKNVNLIGKIDPYVVVHLSDDPKNKQKTPVHQDGGTSPSWNYTVRFTVDDAAAARPGKYVIFTLKHEHSFGADKDLGEVVVPLKELLDGVKDPSGSKVVTYQVKRVSSGKPQGELKLSYKFIDMGQNMGSYGTSNYKPAQSCSSSTSAPYPPPGGYAGGYGNVYPPPQQSTAAGYPPPQSHAPATAAAGAAGVAAGAGIPYAAPAPGGYPPQSHGTGVPYAAAPGPGPAPHGYPQYGGYPPPPAAGYGYGYPPPGGYPPYSPAGGYAQKPQKPKKSGGLGMGLGAGLLGGAIGGLVLGEMVDDAFDVDCDF